MRSKIICFLELCCICLVATACDHSAEDKPSALRVQGFWVDVSGEKLPEMVQSLGANYVLVHAWSTWCAPCVEELPTLLKVTKPYQKKGLGLMLISTDFEASRGKAEKFLRQNGQEPPSFFKVGDDQTFIHALSPQWSGALPATVLFRKDATRVWFRSGVLKPSELKQGLGGLIR